MSNTNPLRAVVERVVANPDMPDLTLRQLAVLMRLAETKEPLSVRNLAGPLSISKPAITRAIDRLGDLGLAERRNATGLDRRLVELRITAQGRGYLAKLDRVLVRTSKEEAAAA